MIDVLKSLKNDLTGRLLPILALAGLALAGAVAYVVLGGGGGSSSPSSVTTVASALPPAPATVASPAPANPKVAISETTSGVQYQRGGPTRDPFVPLPQKKAKAALATTAPKTSSSGSSDTTVSSGSSKTTGGGSATSGSGGGSGGGGTSTTPATTTPAPTPAPSKPKKPQTVYQVALLFGLAPPAGQNPQLAPYENLTRLTPLPSKQNQLLAYTGVSAGAKSAIFTLLQPAILKGKAVCAPSASQCESIALPAGETEELSYIGETGQPYAYLLQVVSIARAEASAHTASRRAAARTASERAALAASNTLGGHGAPHDHSRRVARARAHVHR